MPEAGFAAMSSTAILLENEGRFFFLQPGVGIIGSGDTVSAAYEKFSNAKREYLTEIGLAGLPDPFSADAAASTAGHSLPGSLRSANVISQVSFRPALTLFLTKFCIVLLVIGGLGAIAGKLAGRVVDRVSTSVGSIQPVSIADVEEKTADILKDFRSLPPEHKDALARNIGLLARELQPYFDAWRDPPGAAKGAEGGSSGKKDSGG